MGSREIRLAARGLLLSQRQEKQDILNNHPGRVPISPNHEETIKMRDEVLSNVGTQDMDTSGYQVSDQDDFEFYWENDQLDVDAVFMPSIDTPIPSIAFEDVDMGDSAENHIPLDEEDEKNENSLAATFVFERPTRPAAMLISRFVGTRRKNAPDYVYRKLLQ